MLLIPAIDLKNGQPRLAVEGAAPLDPLDWASRQIDAGADRLQVFDLDASRGGKSANAAIIKALLREVDERVPVQVGGGLRDLDGIERLLDDGVDFVVIGTAAVKSPGYLHDACSAFGGHVLVGLDARDGKVATDGWSKLTGHEVVDLARKYADYGVEGIVYTDLGANGSSRAVAVAQTLALASAVDVPVLACGQVLTLGELQRLYGELGDATLGLVCSGGADLDWTAAQAMAPGEPD